MRFDPYVVISQSSDFRKALRMCRLRLHNAVNGCKKWKLKDSQWKSAFVDIRWTIARDFRIAKMRVLLSSDRVFSRLQVPVEAEALFDEARKIKDSAFANTWYGLKLTVYPDCTSSVEYNLDSNCSVDSHFWDPD
jgi:hypothetical protein